VITITPPSAPFVFTPATGTVSSEGPVGTVTCVGTIDGDRVTGPGTADVKYTYSNGTCVAHVGLGTASWVIPTDTGPKYMTGVLSVRRTGLSVLADDQFPQARIEFAGALFRSRATACSRRCARCPSASPGHCSAQRRRNDATERVTDAQNTSRKENDMLEHEQLASNATTIDELDAITAAVQPYIDGAARGDRAALDEAFHPDARMFGAIGARRFDAPITRFVDILAGSPADVAGTHRARVTAIAQTGAAACVTLVEEGFWGTLSFVDYLSLCRVGGRWRIVTKTFTHTGGEPLSAP
jgi:hypothetical protein